MIDRDCAGCGGSGQVLFVLQRGGDDGDEEWRQSLRDGDDDN